MKILHVTQNYYPSVGGTQHTIKKVSECLHSVYGDNVTVITTNSLYGPNRQKFAKIEKPKETIDGINVLRFAFVRFHIPVIKLYGKALKRLLKKTLPEFLINKLTGPISKSMKKAIDASDADVIGASSLNYLFADYAIRRKHTSRPKPFVLYGAPHLHDSELSPQYKKRIHASDYYIANTEFEKNYLVKLGFEEDKIRVIGTATDILSKADFSISENELLSNYNIAPGTIVITYIGRQEAAKGIPTLIEAFNKISLTHKNARFFACGASGGYTPELKKIAAANKKVTLYNDISDLQKTEILRITDILVLPSKEESFGVVFLEAWSFSKPVIGADIGAVASLIDNGIDGLLFKTGDANSLAEAIDNLINDQGFRKTLGANGNKKVQANYTWDIVARKYREVYELAISKFTRLQKLP